MRVANDAVDSAFLIYLKYIDNYGFTIHFKLSFASFIQWGIIKINTNNEQGPHYKSASLPIAVTEFLQGTAAYDYPFIDNTASTASGYSICALSADTTTVTIGAQLLPGYYGDPVNIRWIAFFKG